MSEMLPMFELEGATIDKSVAESKDGLSAKQLKALNWFIKSNDMRLQLCNPPMQMNFIEKPTGIPVTVSLQFILDEYNEWNEADKKARARERRLEKEFQKRVELGEV